VTWIDENKLKETLSKFYCEHVANLMSKGTKSVPRYCNDIFIASDFEGEAQTFIFMEKLCDGRLLLLSSTLSECKLRLPMRHWLLSPQG
jgi:hypothetical protein